MRARPDQTQWEHLSDASFLGKLLVLLANVRLDWKMIARYKQSSLFGLIDSNEGNKFYNIDTRTPESCSASQFKLSGTFYRKIQFFGNFLDQSLYFWNLLRPKFRNFDNFFVKSYNFRELLRQFLRFR